MATSNKKLLVALFFDFYRIAVIVFSFTHSATTSKRPQIQEKGQQLFDFILQAVNSWRTIRYPSSPSGTSKPLLSVGDMSAGELALLQRMQNSPARATRKCIFHHAGHFIMFGLHRFLETATCLQCLCVGEAACVAIGRSRTI